MTPDAIVLVVVAPTEFINANQRQHWAPRARAVRAWRERAGWAARAARVPAFTEPVHITATIHRDHNRGRFDAANYAPTAKACVDGLVDAGVLVDDSNRYVQGPDMRAGDPWADAALVLTIEKIGSKA